MDMLKMRGKVFKNLYKNKRGYSYVSQKMFFYNKFSDFEIRPESKSNPATQEKMC